MRRLLGTATAVALLTVSLAAAMAVQAGAASGGRPDAAASRHQQIVDYWSADRRAAATPRDIQMPFAKPGGGGGGGGGGTGGGTVTGAAWTSGGDVVLTTGKVFFNMGGGLYVCSGSAVDTALGTVVLTAGHCVKDGAGAFATNWIFYPAYNSGPHPVLGAWTATDLFTTSGWGGSGDFDDDAGLAVVTKGSGTNLEAAIQAAGDGSVFIPPVSFSGAAASYHSFGYPAAKKYNGQTLNYCSGPARVGIDGAATISIACGMTGGSSGGPWIQNFGTPGAAISSLNSYGYASFPGYMFGPIFDGGEQAAYDGAVVGDCPVGAAGFRCVDYAD